MDRKDDEENPPGSSDSKHKRKHKHSPVMVRKKKKTEALKSGGPPENLFPEITSALPADGACGSDVNILSALIDGDGDSTDSECAMDQPTLLEQLKIILDNYQDAQIIRELVQNADDANASEMKIVYVNGDVETSQGKSCYSDYFRAPALCVYNNGLFSKQDWNYIKSIYNSGKREDTLKVGRFGLGFKSVFHITDNPVIISNDRAMIIDPFRTQKGHGNDCQVLTFKKLRKSLKTHYKQAIEAMKSVYGHFGFTNKSLEDTYSGSIFWFSLRRLPSELSTRVFDHNDVTELIDSFKKEAATLPLFLKNIGLVSFSDQEKESASFSVKCDVLEKEEKKSFNRKLKACNGVSPNDSMKAIFRVDISLKDDQHVNEQRWVVCNYIKGRSDLSVKLRELAEDKQLSYSPFVGLATPVEDTTGIQFHGQVFCFLPLPNTSENQTGLPLHVNGFFALSQDRHHVKWPPDDQTDRMDPPQKWNRLLCEEVLVEAYVDTVEYVKGLTVKDNCTDCDTNIVYSILPSQKTIRPNWDAVFNPLCNRLKDKTIFYTNNGGKWIKAKDAIFSILQFIEDELEPSTILQTEQCIFDLLLKYQRNVVKVPSHVAEMFPEVPKITPKYLRNVLRESNIYGRLPVKQQMLLLQFILADRQYADLRDLMLLPLEDDTFRSFDAEQPVYRCTASEMKMFPGTERNFIKSDLPQQTADHLKEIQKAGFCNLRTLDADGFPTLLNETLTANGDIGANGCFSSTTSHITMEWLDHVWSYIGQKKYQVLETFEKLNLVPVDDNSILGEGLKLMPLKGLYLVTDFDGMASLDQNLCNALERLPITVIRHIAKGETLTYLMGTYCKYPNLEGLLELLESLCKVPIRQELLEEMTRRFNDQCNSEEKTALLNFLAKDCQHSNSNADSFIRELAIFPETTNENNVLEFTSVAKNGHIACENSIPVKYHLPHLHLDNIQRMLAKRLGAKEISETKLVENILQAMTNTPGIYERSSIETFMMYVLRYCTRLSSSEDLNDIIFLGSGIKFIATSSSSSTTELAPIRAFFDHTNQVLKELFRFDDSKFLIKKYQKEELESVLRNFGLKSDKDVKEDDVLNVVRVLDRECRKGKQAQMEEIRHCSFKVMEILERMERESTVNLDLREYRWISFIDEKPVHYPDILPWCADHCQSPLCTPQDVSSSKHETQAASVKCIVDTSSCPCLANKYGWNKPPDADTCLLQLEAVRNVFCIKHKAKLNGILKDIYQQLFDDINSLDHELESQPIICTGATFHLPRDVFISFPLDENIHLEPYMYKLPVEFEEFSKMFVELGSVQELEINSLKLILTTIRTSTRPSTTEKDRQMVVKILKIISNLRDANDILSDVLVPVQSQNANLVLQPVKDCTYSDEDSGWLQNEEDDDVNYVHSDVGAKLAESLGVQSFTQRFLSDGGTEEMTVACGQSEPLTTRLKHLLENYPDGLAVLKELVQNADDAGAKHIHFLYDERQNKEATVGLIDVNMAKCQGPAFWAFNDAVFTEHDFENIVKLGGETKKATRTKIGKFGLGFCAVYNITDVPSFVSGNSLVIFDPHTTHLGKAIKNKSSPGIRLTITEKSSGMLKRMRNQFMPYNNIFGCDLSGDTKPLKFEGTLFRFPLRTKQQAIDGEIRSTPYRKDDMVQLLHLLKNCAGDLLTFTQNLKDIKVSHLQEDSVNLPNDIQLMFSVEKKKIKMHHMLNNPANINVMTEAENVLRTKQPFTKTEMISLNMYTLKNELLKVEETCLTSSPWLVSWASGTNQDVLEKAIQLQNDGALPLGSVAVSLKSIKSPLVPVPFPHKEKLRGLYDKSHIFCFLPLPVECKLPVHINGCFAVSSDRKGLVKSTSDEKSETENQVWNRMLMSDAVCKANLCLLTSLEHFEMSSDEIYSTLWPFTVDQSDETSCLSDAFCKAVVHGDYRVFYTPQGRRASFSESVFLDITLRYDNVVGEYAFETFTNLYKDERVPMDMPQALHRQFCTADCEEDLVQQTMTMKEFYEDIVFPHIQQIDAEKRDALVMHILNTDDHSLQNLLKSNPCIPVLPNGRLRLPRDLVRPRSEVSELFCDEDGRFPNDANQFFCSEINLNFLVQLGMMDRALPDELVVERAQSISKLLELKPAFHRCRRLLAYLEREQDNCGNDVIHDLSTTAFLPVLQKPGDWPVTWFSNADETGMFSPPNQMFFPEHMERIACSHFIVNVEELKNEFDVLMILKRLGVQHEELHEDVEKQLVEIGKVDEHISEKQKLRLQEICMSVYRYLDSSSENLTGTYDDLPILWISDQLIPPKCATLETFSRIDCTPEIYQVVSPDVTRYGTFLKRVGVKKNLWKENVILALERVEIDRDKPLELEKVILIVNLLQLLAEVCSRRGLPLQSDEKARILVPDDINILRSLDEVCVDDEFPMPRQKYMYFVNSKVSGEINKLLDIKSKRVKHLNTIKGSLPFGQKEELVTRLKGILDEYPRDETILYELLQNADDAGAKEIMFIEDKRQHKTKEGIFGESWSDIQGPALCVFNDSCFSAADLEGICMLGKGTKSQDPTKTGQFGIGFNAVYHLTDAPSFITRGPSTPNQGTFCAFDPHCTFCPAADDFNPGLQLPDLTVLEETYPGVYECYLQAELPRVQGTWFRFPLRTSKMAEMSHVCKRTMGKESLRRLLCRFQQNMKKCLLFLRNVRQISLCEIDPQGKLKENHTVVSTLEENDEHHLKRFFNKCDTLTKELFTVSTNLLEIPKQTIQYIMTIKEDLRQPERWIIAQTFGLDADTKVPDSVKEALECREINLTPKGAVALPCTPGGMDSRYECAQREMSKHYDDTSISYYRESINKPNIPDQLAFSTSSIEMLRDSKDSDSKGQVFCFLPLPLKTGLPVHINGHFALHQTRGAMWDTESPRGYWNSLLLETTISNSYVLAIEYLRDTFSSNTVDGQIANIEGIKTFLNMYHDSFPRYNQGKFDLIKNMVSSFFAILYDSESTIFPVLSPKAKSIWWVGLKQKEHAFPAFFNNLPDQFWTGAQMAIKEQRQYYGRQLNDGEETKRLQQAENDAHQLSYILKNIGVKITESPLWINESIKEAFQNLPKLRIQCAMTRNVFEEDLHMLDHTFVLRFLRTVNETTPDVCLVKDVDRDLTDTRIKNIENMLCLLLYCLKDKQVFIQNMEQLPLLVTNDRMLRRFSTTSPVFLSQFCDLLQASSKEFVHRKMVNVLKRLQPLNLFLKCLDLSSFARMLPDNVNMASLSGEEPIPWNQNILSLEWMKEFWQYLDTLQQVNILILKNWCVIPGELKTTSQNGNNSEILVPCHKGFILMDSSTSMKKEPLQFIPTSLKIPSPHGSISSKALQHAVASQHYPVRVVECLNYHQDNLRLFLNPNECDVILQYLSHPDNLLMLKEHPATRDQIKNLFLFRTVNGSVVRILACTDIYNVKNHANLLKDGLDVWSNKLKFTLLRDNFFTKDLMLYLDCTRPISVTELYCKLLLPNFHHLERKHHLPHLERVRSMLMDKPSCPLKAALRLSAFIFHEGVFKKANHFYSPHNSFCKKLCDQSMLPPEPFGKFAWKKFMIYAGMNETVSEDLYCQLAEGIERSAQNTEITTEIREKSKAMVMYLFSTDELSNNTPLLKRIRDIRFVEPYHVCQEYQSIYPQFEGQSLIHFCGSVYHSLAPLVWTTISILPEYVSPCRNRNQIQEGLGILHTPPICNVLSHTHNVCDTLNRRLHEQKTNTEPRGNYLSEFNITKLMEKLYAYLQNKYIYTSETKQMLSETPLVHLKEMGIFVTARQVSITFCGKKQIPPYLVEIPLHYGPYKKLFKVVGTTESVTLGQYSDVLYRIQAEVKSAILGPERIHDVLSALTGFMMLLEEASLSSIEESMASVETLYLPASDKSLAKSTDLVYADKQKLKKRVTQGSDHRIVFMHSLKDCNKTEDLILKLPVRIKPKGLSSIIQEHLISVSNNEPDAKVDDLRVYLASQRFLNALKHIGKFEDFDCCRQRLLSICFVSPSEIKTILHVDGRPIRGTEGTQECFYSEGERKCYIAASTLQVRNWLKKIGQQLCGMLSDCFEKRISPEKFRELIDYVDDPTGFKSYCEELLDEEENDDDSLSYHPGQIVPVGLHALLQNDITLLKVGDVVAYEMFDPAIDGDNDDVISKDAASDAVYVFVRIVQEQPLAGQHALHQKYKVNFGQDNEKTVSGLLLYKVIYPESSKTTELVLHLFGNDGSILCNKDGIFDQIIFTLSNAWKLDDKDDRKRVVKRLLLVWHPDKNRNRGDEYENFCKEVTQFIFDIIRRLENGECFDSKTPDESDGGNRRRRRRWNYDNWQYGDGCSNFWQNFRDRMSSRHTKNQSNFRHFYAQRKEYVPDPQPAEARRWFRQASMDYLSGVNSLKASDSTDSDNKTKEDCNWICFKFHQACEKACKAYMYSVDAKKVTKCHYLPNILPYGDELEGLLREIEILVGSYSKMRYPDVMEYPNIPGALYTKDQANKIMELAEKVMEGIENRL
ncbi:sacsin-like [Mizuhopecten yessoensis]|uniref:sacsin-like n=1 Tax=Mizuhopecten yessoensis TaxID=6573 RepID=UPI000B4572B1|nr:sacsin-like [Mizuhopecten yessoensis]